MDQKQIQRELQALRYSLVENLYPQKKNCMFCGRYWFGNKLSAGLCPHCLLKWRLYRQNTRICPLCGSFDCGDPCQGPCAGYASQHSSPMGSLTAIYAASPYIGVYRQRVLTLKYNGQKQMAASLAFLMAETWREGEDKRQRNGLQHAGINHSGTQVLKQLVMGLYRGAARTQPCLVPVPMHRDKEKKRGYNQSFLLALAVSRETGLPVKELLSRPYPGQMQEGLDKWQRQKALDKVFQWSGVAQDSKPGPAIIIDDVVTTGATLETCGEILRSRGYGPVWGLTFAGGVAAGERQIIPV